MQASFYFGTQNLHKIFLQKVLYFITACAIILRRHSARNYTKKKTPLTESLFDVALKLFNLPRGFCGEFAKAEVVTALVKIILTICKDDKADAMIFATIGISNEVISSAETFILANVNLHLIPSSYLFWWIYYSMDEMEMQARTYFRIQNFHKIFSWLF